MTLLTWKNEFSVGIDSVDFEHQELIGLINALYTELSDRQDAAAIEHFLGDIHAAISAHFALEERVMKSSGYDEYLAHKEDHEELLDQIRDLMDEFLDDPDAAVDVLRARLADWFEVHFATFDARLHGKLQVPHH